MGGKSFDWKSLLTLLGSPRIRGWNVFYDNWNQFPEKQDADGYVRWEYKHHRDHGPLFSEELFREIDRGLEKLDYRSRENEFIFSGILFAPDGSRYTGEAAKSGDHLYYRNRKLNKRFPAKHLHKLVFARLKEVINRSGLLDDNVTRLAVSHKSELSHFDKERAEMEEELVRLRKIVDGFGDALRTMVLERQSGLEQVTSAMLEEKEKASQEMNAIKAELAVLAEKKESFSRELSVGGYRFKSFAKLLLGNLEKIHPMELKTMVRKLISRAVIVSREDGGFNLELLYNLEGEGLESPLFNSWQGKGRSGKGVILPLSGNPKYLKKDAGGMEVANRPNCANGRTLPEHGQILSSKHYLSDIITLSEPLPFKECGVLRQKFIVEGLSAREIAKRLGCSSTTVKKYLRLYGIRKGIRRGKARYNLALGEKMVKGRVMPHKAELRIQSMIIDMHKNEKLPARAIARLLDTMKVPTKRQGKKWDHSVVIDILKRGGVWKAA